jgi:hypothetical protein
MFSALVGSETRPRRLLDFVDTLFLKTHPGPTIDVEACDSCLSE